MSRLDVEALIAQILGSRKYRNLWLSESTLRDLLERELKNGSSPKEAEKAVRQKLHNIVAPYLGDPDYTLAATILDEAFHNGDIEAQKEACARLMSAHASTRERLPILGEFYCRLFEFTGTPTSILDLACGLNPLAFPWMEVPTTVQYHAYDIHRPRVDLINHYFHLQGLATLAEQRDILVDPPRQRAEVAFFFKEAHRFEQRQRGCNRSFWLALPVRWLLVSLPSANLTGQHSLVERQRRLVHKTLEGLPWLVTEMNFGSEMVFCIDKNNGA